MGRRGPWILVDWVGCDETAKDKTEHSNNKAWPTDTDTSRAGDGGEGVDRCTQPGTSNNWARCVSINQAGQARQARQVRQARQAALLSLWVTVGRSVCLVVAVTAVCRQSSNKVKCIRTVTCSCFVLCFPRDKRPINRQLHTRRYTRYPWGMNFFLSYSPESTMLSSLHLPLSM